MTLPSCDPVLVTVHGFAGPRFSVEIGILTDLGYTISPGYALFFIGFGLLRRRRGTPRR
jgi:hypothetical protein